MLFALNVVESMDEVQALLTGEMDDSGSIFLEPGEVAEVQDALLLLQQQKQELEQDLLQLEEDQKLLEEEKTSLADEIDQVKQAGMVGDEDAAKARAERLAQSVALYAAMRPADAAAIMDGLSDNLILEILPQLEQRQAGRILNGLADDAKKVRLSEMLVEGEVLQPQP